MLKNIITFGILIAALIWYLSDKKKPASSLDELIAYKEIHPNGVVELENYRYRLVLEYEPINIDQMSASEKAIVWLGFREYLNCLLMPVTHIIQSRKLDLKNYFTEIKAFNQDSDEKIKKYAEEYAAYYSQRAERQRDHKYYAILSFDALELASIDSGIKVDNDFLNAFTQRGKKKKDAKMSPDEYQTLAFNELDDQTAVIQYTLGSLEINVRRLGKLEVADFLNHTLNRDLAPVCTVWEAHQYQMFSGLINYSYTSQEVSDILAGKEAAVNE